MTERTQGRASKDRGWSPWVTALVFVGLSVFALAMYAGWYFKHVTHWGADYGNAGAFGDAFGPITGLLSSLTLAAAVLSVFMQRRELELQREDLEETREVFREQKEAQEAQARAQAKANTLAEERLEFERERFSWEIKVQDTTHVGSIAAAEATALATRVTAYELVLRMRDSGGVLTSSERQDLNDMLTETGRLLGALDELRAVSLLHVPIRKTTPP